MSANPEVKICFSANTDEDPVETKTLSHAEAINTDSHLGWSTWALEA
jgi:hypothetical protein